MVGSEVVLIGSDSSRGEATTGDRASSQSGAGGGLSEHLLVVRMDLEENIRESITVIGMLVKVGKEGR